MLLKKTCSLLVFILIFAVLTGPTAFAGSEITLERAREKACESGPNLRKAEVEHELAKEQLIEAAGYYDSTAMREDIEQLEAAVEEWEEKIAGQEELIASMEQKTKELEEDDSQLMEIKEELARAREDKKKLDDELTDLRRGRSQLLARYRQAKAVEDEVGADRLRKKADRSGDMLEIMPEVIDYHVKTTYFNLLFLQRQQKLLRQALSHRQNLHEVAEIKEEMGLVIPGKVAAAEEKVREGRKELKDLQHKEDALRRKFRKLLGLPLDEPFALYDLSPSLPDRDQLFGLGPPELEKSVQYRRAEDELENALYDLEDTSPYDRRKYRAAELEVEKAGLELEETAKELRANYEEEKETLAAAAKKYENERFGLKEAECRLDSFRSKYEQEVVSGLEFKEKKLEVREKELSYRQARTEYYLQAQSYLLARIGIVMDED